MACSLSVMYYHRLFLRHKNRASSSFPSSSSFVPEHEEMVTHKTRHTEIELLCSRTIQIQNKNCCHNGASRSRKEVVSLLSERLRQGSCNSSFRLLRQGKPIQKRSFSFRTLATTEQGGYLSETLRQRKSVQTRSISCRTLATAELLGPEKKHHSFKTLATTEVGAEKKMKYLSLGRSHRRLFLLQPRVCPTGKIKPS